MMTQVLRLLIPILLIGWSACVFGSHSGLGEYSGRNAPPHLGPSAQKELVEPNPGFSEDLFTFNVEYFDENGDPPAIHQVWIDLNGDGAWGAKEKFDMELRGADGKVIPKEAWPKPFASWQRFVFSLPIVNNKIDSGFSFRFVFHDGKDAAVEWNSASKKSVETNRMIVRPTLVVDERVNTYEAVPGGNLRLEIPLYVEKKKFKNMEFSWTGEGLEFAAGITLSNQAITRRSFNRDYDVVTLALSFEVGASVDEKVYALDIPPIHYFRKGEVRAKKRIIESVRLSGKKIMVVPFVVRPPRLSAEVVTLGNAFDYRLSFLLGAGMEEKDALERILLASPFAPFKVLSRKVGVIEFPGGANEISAHVFLSLEDVPPGTYALSELNMGKLSAPKKAVVLVPIHPPAKVAESREEIVLLTQALKETATPDIPNANVGEKKSSRYFLWAGIVLGTLALLIFVPLLSFAVRSLMQRFTALRKKQKALALYQHTRASFEKTKEWDELAKAYHAYREYLFLKYHADIPEGMPAKEMVCALKGASLAEQNELKLLEDRWFRG